MFLLFFTAFGLTFIPHTNLETASATLHATLLRCTGSALTRASMCAQAALPACQRTTRDQKILYIRLTCQWRALVRPFAEATYHNSSNIESVCTPSPGGIPPSSLPINNKYALLSLTPFFTLLLHLVHRSSPLNNSTSAGAVPSLPLYPMLISCFCGVDVSVRVLTTIRLVQRKASHGMRTHYEKKKAF